MEITKIQFDVNGLIPAVLQDSTDGEILMVGYMNKESLSRTLESNDVWFYSRSREELWLKGGTSGNRMKMVAISPDCDGDALLLKVEAQGPACHTGQKTCFYEKFNLEEWESTEKGVGSIGEILDRLASTISSRNDEMPDGSYTTELLREGLEKIGQKVIEEAGETALAALGNSKSKTKQESADLLYHLLVLLESKGVSLEEVAAELVSRYK